MTGPEERSPSPSPEPEPERGPVDSGAGAARTPASQPTGPPGERSFAPAAVEPAAPPVAAAHEPDVPPTAPAPAVGSTPPPAGYSVPPRPRPLPPPRPVTTSTAPLTGLPPRGPARPTAGAGAPQQSARAAPRGRRARLTLRRIDPWSVFRYSVVASIFLGLALLVCVAVLYSVLSKLGVLASLNTLIGDVTSEPGQAATPSNALNGGRIMSIAAVVAVIDVVLLTALATMGAFLYNLCAALTGGIEVTFGDRE